MLFKLAFVAAAFATLASAGPGGQCIPSSSCSTGPVQCCDTLTTGTSAAATTVLASIPATLTNPNVNVGLNCNFVVSGGTCDGQALCCADNSLESPSTVSLSNFEPTES
ncbi:hypothetical protein GYMLUDRAFT_239401 [Collybiopsis luxurians FD-317 M1]|nr:hypothetical protein GYMLUDRAFT_239401 [Collybiopsis luxurians FD-317 M1]